MSEKNTGAVLKDDIQVAAGPLQAATDLKGGAEAAVHSMREVFEQESTDDVMYDAPFVSKLLERLGSNFCSFP